MMLLRILQELAEFVKQFHNGTQFNDSVAEMQIHVEDSAVADKIGEVADRLMDGIRENIETAVKEITDLGKATFLTEAEEIDPESLEELAEVAKAFDESGDEFLQKQASVIDELLYTLAAPKNAFISQKKAEDNEINKLREKARSAAKEKDYDDVKKELDKQNKVSEVQKAVAEQIKERLPGDVSLSTRSCPEHPGAQMARIGDNEYQCSLDHKVYNWEEGFKTMKGNDIPGGSVKNQIPDYGDRESGALIFDTRESVMNRAAS